MSCVPGFSSVLIIGKPSVFWVKEGTGLLRHRVQRRCQHQLTRGQESLWELVCTGTGSLLWRWVSRGLAGRWDWCAASEDQGRGDARSLPAQAKRDAGSTSSSQGTGVMLSRGGEPRSPHALSLNFNLFAEEF